ncbi:MAG: hypothetical protein P4M11_15820 [Candidatus Pacebacteria bacterium]|nr:hypothetical protein [Candidatus Paceibacterota bacterium]
MRNPSDFYDAIAKRQAEMMQRQHEELKKKAHLTSLSYPVNVGLSQDEGTAANRVHTTL